jgi:hypothetical protein
MLVLSLPSSTDTFHISSKASQVSKAFHTSGNLPPSRGGQAAVLEAWPTQPSSHLRTSLLWFILQVLKPTMQQEAPRSPEGAKPGTTGSLQADGSSKPPNPHRAGIWQALSAQSDTSDNVHNTSLDGSHSKAGQLVSMQRQVCDQPRWHHSRQLAQELQVDSGSSPGTQLFSNKQGPSGVSSLPPAPAPPPAAAAGAATDSGWLATHGASQQQLMQQEGRRHRQCERHGPR